MAGPSVLVRILGDLSGLAKSATDVATTAAGAGSRIHSAFSSVLGTLNKTGVLGPFSEALAAVDEGLSGIAEHSKSVGAVMLGVGGVMVGVGGTLAALGSKEKASHQQLQAAVEATGASYEDYAGRIEKAIKGNEKYGQSSEATQDALRVLTQATGSPAKALQLLGTATDLAAAKHEDLSSAATALGKVYNGNTKLLKEFGITAAPKAAAATKGLETATRQATAADKSLQTAKQKLADIEALDAGKKKLTTAEAIRLRDAQQKVRDASLTAVGAHQRLAAAQDVAKKSSSGQNDAMTALSQKLHGQAAAAADTFTGKLKGITTAVEDQVAQFGEKYGPALTAAGGAITVMGGAVEGAGGILKAFRGAQEGATAATDAATAATEAGTVAEGLALGPVLLIIAGIAALIAIAYVIYRNWGTIWNGMKAAVKAVWDWIKTNWPLLLAILLGPIGVAVDLIVKNWGRIKAGASDAVAWIKSVWNGLVAFFTGIPGRIAAYAGAVWDAVKRATTDAVNFIKNLWNGFVSWVAGLPDRILQAVAALAGLLKNIGSQMIQGLIDGIGSMAGAVADKIKSVVTAPINAAKKILHIGSPSRVFEDIGADTIAGFIQGVGKMAGQASSAVTGALGAPVAALPSGGAAAGGLAPAAAYGGPAVVVQSANFATELDVEAFMRKAAWVVQTQRV